MCLLGCTHVTSGQPVDGEVDFEKFRRPFGHSCRDGWIVAAETRLCDLLRALQDLWDLSFGRCFYQSQGAVAK